MQPEFRVYLQVERVEIGKGELSFYARRVVPFRDASEQEHLAIGQERRHRIRWSGSTPPETELKQAAQEHFQIVRSVEEDWPDYWPPRRKRETVIPTIPEEQPGVFRIGGEVSAPFCEDCPPPEYTKEMKKAGIDGVLGLHAVISESGQPHGFWVVKSLHPALDSAAALTVGRWHFRPALRVGRPVPVYMYIELEMRDY